MLQVGCSHPGFRFSSTEPSEKYNPLAMTVTPNGPGPGVTSHSPPTPPYALPSGRADKHNVVVHWTQGGHSFTSGNQSDEDPRDAEFRPFTPPPPRERLSYTRYQLELLNGIYKHVKYPNSTQKLLVAKRVGITRDQVKIWFQNRRRKDVLAKQGQKAEDGNVTPSGGSPASATGDDNDENKEESMVPGLVMESVINELIKFKNEHLKSKRQKGKKKAIAPPAKVSRPEVPLPNTHNSKKATGLFTGYDMISPPNQVTPSAYSEKSREFLTIGHTEQSAFERPSDKHRQTSPQSFFKYSSNPHSGSSNNHAGWQSYLPIPQMPSDFRLDNNDTSRRGVTSSDFISGQTNHCVEGNAGSSQQLNTNSCALPSPGSHIETIPVLSDLLGHSGRQYSCEVRSRDALCYGQENLPRERNELHFKLRPDNSPMAGFPLPSFPPQIPIEPLSPNRAYSLPITTDPAAMFSTGRHAEPCRPQPHYPSSFSHTEPAYQPLPFSSLSNPFHSQHQPFAQTQQWHDISYQDHSYLQL